MTIDLRQKSKAIDFYNLRYSKGYMDDWSLYKINRIYKLLKELNLPTSGRALEFGCGNGVFCNILKKALPNWEVTGCDISSEGIKLAKQRYPDIKFALCDDPEIKSNKYNFIFSHHTLEHVQDIELTSLEMNNLLTKNAFLFHILPCGNEGSFEFNFCKLVKNGIDTTQDGRFFFEDPGHLRRLSSWSLSKIFGKYNFSLSQQFYSNQFFGAINWITKASPIFIFKNILLAKGDNAIASFNLFFYKLLILFFSILRQPALLFERFKRNIKFIPINLIFLFIYPLCKSVDLILDRLADREWNKSRGERNGSEMYLFFSRL
jgi:SAM-dependent methyltransferase